MTREEIKDLLKFIIRKCDLVINNENYTADEYAQDKIEDIAEMCHRVLDGQFGEIIEPSIPSNIDEAAIPESEMVEWMEYGPHTNYPWCGIPDAIKITAEHFFALGKQAGAEWMAGQGVILNLSIDELSCGAYNACVEQGLTSEDDVIFQIRKKQ